GRRVPRYARDDNPGLLRMFGPAILASGGVGGGVGAAGDAVSNGGFGHVGGDELGDAAVEDAGDDVVLGPLFIGDDGGDGAGGGELHVLGNGAGLDVEGAAEDAGEAEDVVDLVGVVAAAGGHDASVGAGLLGRDLRIGVGEGEDDGVGGHAAQLVDSEDAG